MTGGMDARSPGVGRSHEAGVRGWALGALVAQVAFVSSWLIAASWQGPRYSVLAHSISDMYAVGAPNGAFLVVVISLCGAATILFAWLSLRPSLRPAAYTHLWATGAPRTSRRIEWKKPGSRKVYVSALAGEFHRRRSRESPHKKEKAKTI